MLADDNSVLMSPTPPLCSPTCPFLVVLVCSAVGNSVIRDTIRTTLAQVEEDQKDQVKVIFLVGKPPENDEVIEDMLKEEASMHGDLVQEDFMDTYENLTIKTMMLLKWFNQIFVKNMNKPEFVFKTDDDMYINLEKLVQAAMKIRGEKVIMGNVKCSDRVIRDPSSKWYCPEYLYAEDFYPQYVFGSGYLMSSSAAQDLYLTALDTPALHMEDVFFTGIVAGKIPDLKILDDIGFSNHRARLDNKFIKKRKHLEACVMREVVSTHRIKPSEMKIIHRRIMEIKEVRCPKIKDSILRAEAHQDCN